MCPLRDDALCSLRARPKSDAAHGERRRVCGIGEPNGRRIADRSIRRVRNDRSARGNATVLKHPRGAQRRLFRCFVPYSETDGSPLTHAE